MRCCLCSGSELSRYNGFYFLHLLNLYATWLGIDLEDVFAEFGSKCNKNTLELRDTAFEFSFVFVFTLSNCLGFKCADAT